MRDVREDLAKERSRELGISVDEFKRRWGDVAILRKAQKKKQERDVKYPDVHLQYEFDF